MKLHRMTCCLLSILAAVGMRAADGPLMIKNGEIAVAFDAESGLFSLTSLPSNKTFIKDGILSGSGGNARVGVVQDILFGQGQAIQVAYTNGNSDAIELYPGIPFALFRSTLHNLTTNPIVVNRLTSLTVPLNLGPAEKLNVLGSGGLSHVVDGALKGYLPRSPLMATPIDVPPTKPGDEYGSYVWLAVAEPQSRQGVVGAWMTGYRASGVVFPRVQNGVIKVEAQSHYGHLRVKPDQKVGLETFALGYFDDAREGLEVFADIVARLYAIKLPKQPVGFCTWYMEKFDRASDEKHFAELSAYAAKHLKPWGFEFVQIDDYWQKGIKPYGPKKNFTDYNPEGPYPSGMKAAADMAKDLGLRPGIWFMPFSGNDKDPFFADKMDLFVRTLDGKPYNLDWADTCLDMSNPKAQAYLRDIVKRLYKEWGFTLFKMDGDWAALAAPHIYMSDAYREDGFGNAVFSNPEMSNIEVFRNGFKVIREAVDSKVFLLGCAVSQNMRSMQAAFGLVDSMRVGPDTGREPIGAPWATWEYFLNGRVWYNDPDCVSVRTNAPGRKLRTLGEARANASFASIAGNLFYNSDWIPELPPERLDILRRTMRPHQLLTSRPVDLLETGVARIWHLSDTRVTATRRDIVGLFNWNRTESATIQATLQHIGLDPNKEYVAFDYWDNKLLGSLKDNLSMTLPANSCLVLAVRPVSDHPQLLSTSVHVTQGIVDVTSENWSEEAKTLSGQINVVGTDPSELRIALPLGGGWKVNNAAVEGLKTEIQEEAGLVRVSFTAPVSREVSWMIRFTK